VKRRHKWRKRAQRTRQCEHCGWRERWKLVGKMQVVRCWYERGDERQDFLPKCAPVGQDNVARGAAAMQAATQAEIKHLEEKYETSTSVNVKITRENAELRVERDMMQSAAFAQIDRQKHWKQIVKVLRRRLSEQAAIIHSYENDGDPRRNVTAGLLQLEQRQRETQCEGWRRLLDEKDRDLAFLRSNPRLYQPVSVGADDYEIPFDEAPSDMRIVDVSGPDSRGELDEGDPDRGDW
jgi:hypothetical protein